MDHEDIRRAVREIVMEIFELEPTEILDDASFSSELGGDSLKALDLMVALERRFDIHYAVDERQSMNSIDVIVKVTENRVGK